MPTENSVITREHLPGLLLARTIWENGGPSLYFPPALQDATDQARAALPAPASVPDGYMPIPTAEQIADALDGVRCYHDMSAELIAPELLANLLAATTVKAEQVQCEVCHGQGEVYSGHDQHFHYFDFQPPEPIMEVCPECGGEEAPSLPAAGSAVEEVVPQYQRGALLIDSDTMSRFTRIAREAAISGVHRYSYMPTTPEEAKNWHPHSWVIDAMHLVQRDALSALSAQQSAPVPKESSPLEVIGYASPGQIAILRELPRTGGMKVKGRKDDRYSEPLVLLSDARSAILSLAVRCQQEGAFKTCLECGYQDGHDEICQFHASNRMVQQSTPERTDGWISVSERLPDVAQEVIVDSEFDGVTAGFLDSYGEWYSPNSDYKLTRVVAWQPLPAAPSLLASHGRGEA